MPNRDSVIRSIYGAWRLAVLDPSGMAWFDLSIKGFWRSFFAAVIVAPFYALALVLSGDAAFAADAGAVILVKGASYVLSFIAFPVAMILLCRLLSLTPHYVAYIVAVNWSAVIQMAAFLPFVLLGASGAVSPGVAGSLLIAVSMAVLFYAWFITTVALRAHGATAVALVLVDLLLGIVIDAGSDRLLVPAGLG
jgi:hypothetical protein